jgi:hypothetical protein
MSSNNRTHELLEFFKTNPPPEEVYERYYDENVFVQAKPKNTIKCIEPRYNESLQQ